MTNKEEISCQLFYSADFNIPEDKNLPTPRQPQSSPDRDIAYYLEICNYYLNQYFEERYGKDSAKEMYEQLTRKKEVFFYLGRESEPSILVARDLVSEETAYIILQEFLKGKNQRELDPNIYLEEIKKRNY
ncbi:MAG: hypothetical protein QNJ72_30370 [Pleurocapsa sp. MO_226.B13]|nr:hypothetical protein [Pleurocapsa sp. MO_226.B13]